jgi:peptide/nickel transport system permease protein
MASYIARRLLQTLGVLVIVSAVTFTLVNLLPGDIVVTRLGDNATPQDVAKLRTEMGLDEPLPIRYVQWIGGLLTGDPGKSLTSNVTVTEQLQRRIPVTLELAILGIALSVVIGVPLGVVSAAYRDRPIDHFVRVFAVLGQAVPGFWLAILALTLMSIYFSWVPPFSYKSVWDDPIHNFKQFWLPALLTGYGLSASVMRLTRAAMLEVLSQDYIRTARAKGLGAFPVTYRHALRNALIPIVTIVGAQVGGLIGGAILIETVFSLPGVGRLTLQAISDRDYTQIQFNVLVIGFAVSLVNLLVDISYGYLDPRIRP